MSKTKTFLPNYQDTSPKAAEYLRQALPLMSQNGVATNPINYAIWYEYVSGENLALVAAVDSMIEQKQAFDEESNDTLYRKFIFDDSIDSLERIHKDLGKLLANTMISVNEANEKAITAEGSLNSNSEKIQNAADLSEVTVVLNNIIKETRELASTSNLLKRKLHDTTSEIAVLRKELNKTRETAITDSLTGLLNRGAFDQKLGELLKLNQDESQLVSLLFMDLDNFKNINDNFGHLVGDKVIRFTAALIKQHISKHHIAARYGGEEVAIIMPDTSRQKAVFIAEKMREALSRSKLQRKESGETIGQVTISIGVSQLKQGDSFDDFVNRADKALYLAKENGRNCVIDETALDD
jgi:diguanylate cyclase